MVNDQYYSNIAPEICVEEGYKDIKV